MRKWVIGNYNAEYRLAWALIQPCFGWGNLEGATQFDSASEAREFAKDAEGDFVVPLDVARKLDL